MSDESPASPHATPVGVVDASVWISRFVPSDVNYTVSHAWLQARLGTGATLAAPRLLLVEVGTAIARRVNDNALATRIAGALESEPQVQLLDVDASLIASACRLGIMLRLRAADAIYAALARQLRVPLYS